MVATSRCRKTPRTKGTCATGCICWTVVAMMSLLCRCATTTTCLGLLLNRWLWYTAWAAVIARVSTALHQGERPEAA